MKIRLILALTSLISTHAALMAQQEDRVVAVVDQKVFTTLDVRQSIKNELAALEKSLKGKQLEEQSQKLFSMALDALINKELIFLDFKNLKANVPAFIIQERVDAAVAKTAGGDIILFEDNLYKQGMTMTEFREKIYKDIAVELLLRNKVKTGVSIPDSAVTAFYEKHKYDMVRPPRYHLAVIMLKGNGRYAGKLDETFNTIQQELKNGKTFEQLVKQFSEGANAENAGDQGWLDSPHPELKKAVENLDKGQVSPAKCTIGNNLYIVKLVDVVGRGVPKLDDKLKDSIRQKLTQEEEQVRYRQYIKELHMKYAVRRMDSQAN